MDAAGSGFGSKDTIYRVRDTLGLLLTVLFIVVLAPVDFYFNARFFAGAPVGFMFTVITLVLWFLALRLKALWDGIELNLDKGTMSFPGGQISANSLSDYINPVFWFQSLTRFTIDIEQIGQISTSLRFNQKANVTGYVINFVGTFGAASVTFREQGKRDEIYNAIRQINKMGTPYVKA